MEITDKDIRSPKRDLSYWRDVIFAGLGVLCTGGAIGHFLDWFKERKSSDVEISVGFLIGFGVLFALSPQRLEFVIVTLLSMVVIGAVNAFAARSVVGLPLILPCALLAYVLLRFWARRTKS